MRAHGDGGACRGATWEPGTCSTPWGCTMAEWGVCRKEQPERARDAVRSLAMNLAGGRDASESETDLLEAVADRAFAADPGQISRCPAERVLSTWVSDLLWEETSVGRTEAGLPKADHLSSPSRAGPTWEAVGDFLLVEARRWVRFHGLPPSEAKDLAQDALVRLLEQQRRGHEVLHLKAWTRRVFLSRFGDAARGRAGGPLPPQRELSDHVTRELRNRKVERSPEEKVARQELAEHHLRRLPLPYRQVAWWEALGWRYGEIVAQLRKWRPISKSVAQRLICRTREMLKALGDGENLNDRWSRRFREEYRWRCMVSPLNPRLRTEGERGGGRCLKVRCPASAPSLEWIMKTKRGIWCIIAALALCLGVSIAYAGGEGGTGGEGGNNTSGIRGGDGNPGRTGQNPPPSAPGGSGGSGGLRTNQENEGEGGPDEDVTIDLSTYTGGDGESGDAGKDGFEQDWDGDPNTPEPGGGGGGGGGGAGGQDAHATAHGTGTATAIGGNGGAGGSGEKGGNAHDGAAPGGGGHGGGGGDGGDAYATCDDGGRAVAQGGNAGGGGTGGHGGDSTDMTAKGGTGGNGGDAGKKGAGLSICTGDHPQELRSDSGQGAYGGAGMCGGAGNPNGDPGVDGADTI